MPKAKFRNPFSIHKQSTLGQKIGRAITLLGFTIQSSMAMAEASGAKITNYWVWVIVIGAFSFLGPTIADFFTPETITQNGQD